MTRSAVLFAAAMVLMTTSCKDKTSSENKIPLSSTPPADSIHQQAAARTPFEVQLDSGNIAFRAKDYTRAREYYTHATQVDSMKATGWFGIYMAEEKLGNHAAAEYAMKRAGQLNPQFKSANPHATSETKEPRT